MKVCPKCGQVTNDDSDEFCTRCGAYYTTKQSQQHSNPMAAALGMVSAPEASKPTPRLENGTLKAGFDDLSVGNFLGAMMQWTSWVRNSGQPDKETYDRMVEESALCVINQLGLDYVYEFTGITDLAMELDEDFIQDLINVMMSRVQIRTNDQAADLSKFVMKVALDSFTVYPDLRDEAEFMKDVSSDMDKISSMMVGITDDEGRAQLVLNIHKTFADMMYGMMIEGIEDAGDERMDLLADYWANKATLPYANIVNQIYVLYSQIHMATGAGKLTKKLFQKGLNLQIDGFRKSYFGPKV